MPITLEFGDELQEALRVPVQEQESRLRLELSMRLYEKGLLTLGKARQLAGKEKWEYLLLLAREGIPRQYDEQELERDILTLDTLS
jgi:predicted HTH domain antitoxin